MHLSTSLCSHYFSLNSPHFLHKTNKSLLSTLEGKTGINNAFGCNNKQFIYPKYLTISSKFSVMTRKTNWKTVNLHYTGINRSEIDILNFYIVFNFII